SQHREISIVTGTYNGTPVSVVSTGMGAGSVEIVINEIHVLKEYDMARRAWRPRAGDSAVEGKEANTAELFDPASVKIIRVGTCGSPMPTMPVTALAVTRYAIGMDNSCLFYKAPEIAALPDLQEVRRAVREHTGLRDFDIYVAKAHPTITQGIVNACEALNRKLGAATSSTDSQTPQACVVGATATTSGFYAPQGRVVGRFHNHITVPNLVDELGQLRMNVSEGTEVVANIEMETSVVCYLSQLLGYRAGAVCVVVAKRAGEKRETASVEQTKKAVSNAVRVALEAIVAI
ncbi:nucleoside phosphorylase, partial [Trypanosoma theileri]